MYSAKEAAEITGLSPATLRYYEKEGLLPPIARTAQNYRQYSDEDITWLNMIQCLRTANVPIHSIKQYVALLRQGSQTIDQRYTMILSYKNDIEKQISDLQNALALAQRKLIFYQKLLERSSSKEMTALEEWQLFRNGGKQKE